MIFDNINITENQTKYHLNKYINIKYPNDRDYLNNLLNFKNNINEDYKNSNFPFCLIRDETYNTYIKKIFLLSSTYF